MVNRTNDKVNRNKIGITRRKLIKVLSGAFAYLMIPSVSFAGSDKNMSDKLIKKSIPSTGEYITAVGLGTARAFNKDPSGDLSDLREVMDIFYKYGGRLVDTSPMYGNAEEVIGILSSDLGISDELFTATKVWTTGKENGINQMNESLKLLKTSTIDLMQVHNLVDTNTQLQTIDEWKKKGKIRYSGITHYRTDAYPALIRDLKYRKFDFVQFNYSIETRGAEKELLPLAAEKGVAVIINEPFEKGNLFRKVKGKSLPDWAAEFDCKSWAQYFLKYIISNPAVTCVIPATSDPKHMKDNIGAAYGKLPDDKMRKKMIEYLEKL